LVVGGQVHTPASIPPGKHPPSDHHTISHYFDTFRHYQDSANDHQAEFVVPFVQVSTAVGYNVGTAEPVSSLHTVCSFPLVRVKFLKIRKRRWKNSASPMTGLSFT